MRRKAHARAKPRPRQRRLESPRWWSSPRRSRCACCDLSADRWYFGQRR